MILIPGLLLIFALYSGAIQFYMFCLGVAMMSRTNITSVKTNFTYGIISLVFALAAMITWTL